MNKLFQGLCYGLIILSTVTAGIVLLNRHQVEKANQRVELTLEYRELKQISAATNKNIDTVLRRVKQGGISSISLPEQTLESLQEQGEVLLFSSAERAAVIEQISRAGLKIVLRPSNYRATPESIKELFKEVKDIENLSGIIFSGTEVLGYPDSVEVIARQLRGQEIKVGWIEFVQQKGIKELARDLPIVRVHSIKHQEMAEKDMAGLISRFLRAVQERNVRLLYIHLFGEDLKKNLRYITEIKERLENRGYEIGMASPFENYAPGFIFLFLISLGIGGGIGLLGRQGLGMSWRSGIILVVLLGGIFCALGWWNLRLAQQIFAFLAALTFPVLILSFFTTEARRSLSTFISSVFPWVSVSPWLKTLAIFLGISGVTLIGGLLIAGLLSRTSFMLQVDQFRGVKLAYGLPLIIFLWILYRRQPQILKQPLLLGDALLLGVLVGGAIFGLLRSGNFGFGVSGAELKFRELLEKFLLVRPRFKEFLFGHPALILGIYLSGKYPQRLSIKLLGLLGLVGQVSLINTFCHLHTPITVCLLRSFHGLWLGILFGIILIAFLNKFK